MHQAVDKVGYKIPKAWDSSEKKLIFSEED